MSWLTKFSCRCAGVRMDALGLASGSVDRVVTQGAVMALTGLVASLTGGYAAMNAFHGSRHALAFGVVFGMIWGLFVFLLDRKLTNTIIKPAPWWRLILLFASRLPIAYVVAWTMSMPVVLRVSAAVIDAELRQNARQTTDVERRQNAEIESVEFSRAGTRRLEATLEQHEARLRGEPDTEAWRSANAAAERLDRVYREVSSAHAGRIAAANRAIATLERLEDPLTPAQMNEVNRLRRNIATWRSQIARADRERSQARAHEASVRAQWRSDLEVRRRETAEGVRVARQQALDAETRAAGRNRVSETEVERLHVPDLINRFTVFHRIKGDTDHPQANALWWWYWMIKLLFLLLELTPLLIKLLGPPDSLDAATAALEVQDTERINLTVNARVAHLQALYAASAALRQSVVDGWRGEIEHLIAQNPKDWPALGRRIERDTDDLAA